MDLSEWETLKSDYLASRTPVEIRAQAHLDLKHKLAVAGCEFVDFDFDEGVLVVSVPAMDADTHDRIEVLAEELKALAYSVKVVGDVTQVYLFGTKILSR